MKTYRCEFLGRKVNALGINYRIVIEVQAENQDDALLKCYEKYEHISGFIAQEVKEEKS